MKEFTASIVIRAHDNGSTEALKMALDHVMAKAALLPPDQRFDWAGAAIAVDDDVRDVKGL